VLIFLLGLNGCGTEGCADEARAGTRLREQDRRHPPPGSSAGTDVRISSRNLDDVTIEHKLSSIDVPTFVCDQKCGTT
jgi:hypothetical protein